ncbi:putative Nitrate/nitrite response regulator protein NarP [Streptomyces aurantiacus JA 4570]|uniref:Putative Nitrate/nitrite response regulator protein NarP n=2 Tax=Streptomyces aurantiacus TaxID=47760 RepID=S3ZRS3_9ACTN|nr:putative Nitrate/nitrite response regulator protein NarP [Streptomyces aurantiacus JA 4570]
MEAAAECLNDLTRIVLRLEGLLGSYAVTPAARVRGSEGLTRPCDGMTRVLHEARLTQREREVVELLVRGLSNRRIACDLNISEPTVKNHLRAAFLKLDVTDRTQAVVKVLDARHQ